LGLQRCTAERLLSSPDHKKSCLHAHFSANRLTQTGTHPDRVLLLP
jgi:hypothetical protein